MDTITKASAATDAVLGQVEIAQERLRRFNGRSSNGFGVLADPSLCRSDLSEAKLAIEAALKAMT